MFLLSKLKKWIELEIKELDECKSNWERIGCDGNAYACKQQIEALENIQYILENRCIWAKHRSHGIFKEKN